MYTHKNYNLQDLSNVDMDAFQSRIAIARISRHPKVRNRPHTLRQLQARILSHFLIAYTHRKASYSQRTCNNSPIAICQNQHRGVVERHNRTQAEPASSALETRIARDTFCVKIPQAKPYVVSLACSIASAKMDIRKHNLHIEVTRECSTHTFLGLEFHENSNRPENLLVHNLHLRCCICEYRRLDVVF